MRVVVSILSKSDLKTVEYGIGRDCDFAATWFAEKFLITKYGKPTYRDNKQMTWAMDNGDDVYATFEDDMFKVGDLVRSNNNNSAYRFEAGQIVHSYWNSFHRYFRVKTESGITRDCRTKDLIKIF